MAMRIVYPCTNSTIPPAFTAWGTYTTADNPTGGMCKATCTSGGGAVINGTTPQFRSDGIWTSSLSGLVVGSTYKVDASYTPSAGGTVVAPSQTDLRVLAAAIPIAPPGEDIGDAYAPVIGLGATFAPAAGVTSARTFNGKYPPFMDIRKVSAVVHETLVAINYSSVTPGILRFGNWSVVVPRPSDLAAKDYVAEILFLDRNGIFIVGTRLNLF